MLASVETIEMVARMVKRFDVPALVVDPVCFFLWFKMCITRAVLIRDDKQVMISTSGAELLPQDAVHQLITHLLPLTTLLTPNIPEAHFLLSHSGDESSSSSSSQREIGSVADLESMARRIQALGPTWVLVKGGHHPFAKDGGEKVVVDVLVGPGKEDVVMVESPWQDSTSTHGTGCTLACK